MALALAHGDSSQDAETGTSRPPTSERNQRWDSPTPPFQDEATATESDKEKDPIVGEKPPQVDPNLVTWTGPDDPANPHNWSVGRKLAITGIWVYGNVVTTIASSIFSSGAGGIAKEFDVSSTVTILGVSLFLLVRKRSIAGIFPPAVLLLVIARKLFLT